MDDHVYKYHTFICQICQHICKTQQELDFHVDIMHDTTPKKPTAKLPEDKEMVRDWRHRTMVEDQQKELDRWRAVKDTAAKEKWDEYWAAWTAQKSLEEEKEKSRKRKRSNSKEDTEDDKDKDPDYVQSEEGSSQDPLYEPSRKELREANKEGDK